MNARMSKADEKPTVRAEMSVVPQSPVPQSATEPSENLESKKPAVKVYTFSSPALPVPKANPKECYVDYCDSVNTKICRWSNNMFRCKTGGCGLRHCYSHRSDYRRTVCMCYKAKSYEIIEGC